MGMTLCDNCKQPLPANGSFCGYCGKKIRGLSNPSNPSHPTNLPPADLSDSNIITLQTTLDDDMPTGISERNSPYGPSPTPPILPTPSTPYPPQISHTQPVPQDAAGDNWGQQVYYPTNKKEDEDEEDNGGAVLPWSSTPAQGNAPFVQSMPQVGNAPFVQGPLPASGPPASPPPLPSALGNQVFRLETIVQPPYHHTATAPAIPNRPGLVQHPHPQPKKRLGCTAIISGVVVIAIMIAAFLIIPLLRGHAQLPPVVTIGNIVAGGNLSVHGSNFSPSGTIDITIDRKPAHLVSPTASSPHTSPLSMNLAAAYQPYGAAGTTVTVQGDGTFNAIVTLDATWTVDSKHILQATEQGTGLNAQVTIILPQAPTLVGCSRSTTTTSLTLGPVNEGLKQPVAATFILCTIGTGIVNWNASWDKTKAPWLQLPTSGQIQAPLTKQIDVSATAGNLKAGTYTSTITFKSSDSNSDLTLKVTFNVRAAQATECVNTNVNSLAFTATQGQSDPAAQSVTITNCGTDHAWSATTSTDDHTNWLTVNVPTNGGTTLKGQAKQDVEIRASGANLQPGGYTGQVTFKIGASSATVNITLTVQPAKRSDCISAVPQTLAFTALQGQANPPAQKTTIGNCGSAGTWTATLSTNDGAHWLHSDATNGSLDANATRDVVVSITSNGLQNGTYAGQIVFSLGASNVTVNVSLMVQAQQPKPCLTVSSSSLSFTSTQGAGDPATQSVTLANCGPADSWSATTVTKDGANWLSATPTSGNLTASSSQTITIAITSGKLTAGNYTGIVTFTSTAGAPPQTVTVLWTMLAPPPPTCIKANPTSLTFTGTTGQSDPAAQTVTLTNCGPTGNWTGADANNTGWLSLSPANGTINANATQDVSVAVSLASLQAKTYTTTITFSITTSTGNAQVSVPVKFTVQQQQPTCLTASSSSLTFTGTTGQGDPSAQSVTLTNCGPTGNWTGVDANNTGWLTLSPASGTINANATQDVSVAVSLASLQVGTYKTTITFSITTSTGNKQASVAVTFNVQSPQPPCLTVDPSSLTFTGTTGQSDPSAQTVTLTNCGPTGAWTSSTDDNNASWLSFTPASGNLNAAATQDVNVAVSMANLRIGTYKNTITFSITTSAGNKQASVAVTFTVQSPQPPCLTVSSTSLSFSATQGQGDPAAQTVTLTNCGPADTWKGTFSSGYGANWLSISPNSGSLAAGATQVISVGATLGNLAPGQYTDTITFSDGTNTPSVSVTFTVSPPPAVMQLSATSLTFTANCSDPPTQTITVSNSGGGPLTWTAGAPTQSWLSVSPGSGTAPSTLTFTVSIKGLTAQQTYTATVDITPSGGSPQTVTVTLTVSGCS